MPWQLKCRHRLYFTRSGREESCWGISMKIRCASRRGVICTRKAVLERARRSIIVFRGARKRDCASLIGSPWVVCSRPIGIAIQWNGSHFSLGFCYQMEMFLLPFIRGLNEYWLEFLYLIFQHGRNGRNPRISKYLIKITNFTPSYTNILYFSGTYWRYHYDSERVLTRVEEKRNHLLTYKRLRNFKRISNVMDVRSTLLISSMNIKINGNEGISDLIAHLGIHKER